jgi:hypothetical protein
MASPDLTFMSAIRKDLMLRYQAITHSCDTSCDHFAYILYHTRSLFVLPSVVTSIFPDTEGTYFLILLLCTP